MIKRPRTCGWCQAPIPESRRKHRAKFCCLKCTNHAARSAWRKTAKGIAASRRNCARYHRRVRKPRLVAGRLAAEALKILRELVDLYPAQTDQERDRQADILGNEAPALLAKIAL